MHNRQVFQSSTATRWQRVKWSSRILIFLFFLLIVAFLIAIGDAGGGINTPRLKENNYKPLKDTQSFVYRNSQLARNYYGFRQFIGEKEARFREPYQTKLPANFRNITAATAPCAIRSAFFVDWDPQSYYSLQRNINKLNLVIPEWLFIDPNTDTLTVSIDPQALAIMQKSGVNIMPMMSNVFHEDFRGDAVHRIITHPAKKAKLISDLIRVLKKNHFAGVNVDFEDLMEQTDEPLVRFQKDLYEQLHAQHLLVTQDIIPFNNDYNYESL
ncbi:MAG TPA: glycosyl transferase family 2, partial [Flavisolibacter sp.]|nr:glycosyl transferase family 2 [Flavisolibacter sp.]